MNCRAGFAAACMGIGCAVVLTGCPPTEPGADPGIAARTPVVRDSIEAMGAEQAWWNRPRVEARLLLSVWTDDGAVLPVQCEASIDPRSDRIRVRGAGWSAEADSEGDGDVRGVGLPDLLRPRLVPALSEVLYRMRGPLHPATGRERAGEVSRTRLFDVELVRVAVESDRTEAAYFDRDSKLLAYATSGADTPGHEGRVVVYRYETVSGGVVFPIMMEGRHLGRHVLVGDRMAWQAEFADVRFP